MKQFIGTLLVTLVMTASQANTKLTNGEHLEPNLYGAQLKTATRNAVAHVKHKRVLKSKVQRAIPFGMDDDYEDIAQTDDLATGYRRRDLTKIEHEDGISDRVRWRLFLARQLALLKYREIHG